MSISQHCVTFKLVSSMISLDLGLIHPWFFLNHSTISPLFVSMVIAFLVPWLVSDLHLNLGIHH